jgi:predicted O-methyltransferase YrrM
MVRFGRMTYEELLRAPVNIHAGRTRTWGISREVADLLHQTATAESVTLETGSGRSTLILLHAGVARHIAIQPSADEFEAIREFCGAEGISTAALEPVVAKSQEYLPHATVPPLDIVLIDGAHAFPFPFVDWYFTASALKPGGLLIVDDVQIATGAILADFLEAEAGWTKVARTRRFAAFHRGTQGLIPLNDWVGQPYLANNYPTSRVLLVRDHPKGAFERAAGRLLPWRFQESLRQRYGWPRPSWVD